MYNTYTSLNLYIWGMGNKGIDFWKQYAYYEEIYEIFPDMRLNIVAVIDSACKKNMTFYGHKVISPSKVKIQGDKDFFVIAVENNAAIRKTLFDMGYTSDSMIYYENFLDELRKDVIFNKTEILKKFLNEKTDYLDNNETLDNRIDKIHTSYKKIEEIDCLDNVKDILRSFITYEIFKLWDECDEERIRIWNKARDRFDIADMLAGASLYFGLELREFADFFVQNPIKLTPRKVKTIGIYDKRFNNGGGPRVISLLLPIYIKMGYKIVFFTEEHCPQEEYAMPDEVIRVIVTNSNNMGKRFFDLLHHIKRYGVQLMCFHNSQEAKKLFFDMIFLHFYNIPVIVEMHVNFLLPFESRSKITLSIPYIYRLADRLIVLSSSNEVFWNNLGCRAKYIPNPLDKKILVNATEAANDNHILWIGRLDGEKRFIDAIDIMGVVVKKIPNAVLEVVGKAENSEIEKRLKSYVDENNLTNNVIFNGFSKDVDKFYQKASVMLFTSSARLEGFPMVIIESKCHGVPLVLYDLPYLELLKNKMGYIAVPQRDKKAAAKAIISILKNDKLREELSKDARASIDWLRNYDIGKAWTDVFNEFSSEFEYEEHKVEDFAMIERLLLEGMENCKK